MMKTTVNSNWFALFNAILYIKQCFLSDEESTRSSSETLQLNGEMDSLDDVRRSRDETPEGTRQPVDFGRGKGLRHTLVCVKLCDKGNVIGL